MAIELPKLVGESTGFRDSSNLLISTKIIKSVDITEDCPKLVGQARLDYSRDTKHGLCIHIVIGELTVRYIIEERDRFGDMVRGDLFGDYANRLGLTKADLKRLIFEYAPAFSSAAGKAQ